MKTNSILIKEGKAFAVCEEIPKEPKYKVNCGGTHACTCAGLAFESGANRDVVDGYDDNCPHRYAAALQRVKDNAVLFDEKYQYIKYHIPGIKAMYASHHEPQHELYEINDSNRKEAIEFGDIVQLKEGEFYPLSVEVEIIEVSEYPIDHTSYPPMKSVARIVEEPEEERSTMDFTKLFKDSKLFKVKDSEVEDQESQSELFRQVVELFNHQHKLYGRPDYQLLKERFSITRIKQ